MKLSHEGVTLLMRVLLIRPSGHRGGRLPFPDRTDETRRPTHARGDAGRHYSFGLFLSPPVSRWMHADASVVCACVLGLVVGWSISFLVARRLPMKPLAEDPK